MWIGLIGRERVWKAARVLKHTLPTRMEEDAKAAGAPLGGDSAGEL